MKILHVVPAYHPEGPGGIEVYTRSLVAAQRRRGLRPVVLTGHSSRWEAVGHEVVEVDGCRVLRLHRDDLYFHHYAKAYHPGVEAWFENLLADEAPDLVHVHHWLRLTCNIVEIAARCGVPAVVTLHDVLSTCPRGWRIPADGSSCSRPLAVATCRDCVPRWGCETAAEVADGIELFAMAFRHELTRAQAVLVASPAIRELVATTQLVDPARFTVMPLGYARRSLVPLPRPQWPEPGEPFRIAHWGNLGRHKGVATLVRAVRLLAGTGAGLPPFELHLLGPPESAAFGDELRALAGQAPVVCHGAFTFADLVRLRPHLGVFPSTSLETFSFVLEECFELGLPCIVSDLGALPQRVGGGGLVVPAGDALALAEALRRIVGDRAVYEQLAGRVPPLSPTMDEHGLALELIYERALTAAPPTATPPVDLRRWAMFLLRQRESAQARVCREGGPQ